MKLKTIKVTEETVKNLNIAAGYAGKKQYEIAEEASKDVLSKISAKIKSTRKTSENAPQHTSDLTPYSITK